MKKKIVHFVFACLLLQAVFSSSVFSNTTVTISYSYDSTFTHCPVPILGLPTVAGLTIGYPNTDSVNIHVYFGDGNDSSYWTTFYYTTGDTGYFSGYFQHIYASAGQFSVKYVVTGTDGNADSSVNVDEFVFGDTCGNISGRVYLDNNSNCIYDSGDSVLWGYPVALYSGPNIVEWSYTDSLGMYYFSVPTGFAYTVVIDTFDYSFVVTCPSSGQYSIPTAPSTGNDFAMNCPTGFDLIADVYGHRFHPGLDGWAYVWVGNAGCIQTSGQAKLIIDTSKITFLSSVPSPTSVSGDTIIWDFTTLQNTYYYWWWYYSWWYNGFYASISYLTNTNAVLGDTVCLTLIVDPMIGDNNPANNIATACYPINLSWDPNYKTVNPQGIGPQGYIAPNQPLTYNVHFQNTGTDTAHYVAIYDTLSANLDVRTLQVLNSDHPMTTEIIGTNVVKFSFTNILLPDSATNPAASQGEVTYTIKPKAGLANGTVINNTAGIVFEYNKPVMTNTTINTIDASLGIPVVSSNSNASHVTVFPNPAVNELNIVFNNQKTNDVQLVDVLGNIISKYNQVKGNLIVNTTRIPSGIYTLVVNSNDSIQREKVIIIH